MNNLKKFKELVENSDAIIADSSPYPSSWFIEETPEKCDADGTVFEATWTDDGWQCACDITRAGVEAGGFTEDAFVCKDCNGKEVSLEFYVLENLLSGKRIGR